MSDFVLGLCLGLFISGVVRISIGRFVIHTAERGWVFRWSRFDEEDKRIRDRVNAALKTGEQSGYAFAYRKWIDTGEVPAPLMEDPAHD